MKEVTLKDKTFRLSIPEEEILRRVKLVADRINKDYAGSTPVFIPVLGGSFMFASDLLKEMSIDCQICFCRLSSYVGTESTGKVQEVLGVNEDLTGRDVIIVEDIVETGRTMAQMVNILANRGASSVKICSLFFKPSRLVEDINVDYVAFEIPDDFIVGYGLDYDQLGRNLRDVYVLK